MIVEYCRIPSDQLPIFIPVWSHCCQEAIFQEAKTTLTDPHSRALYDKWRMSGIAVPYGRWRHMQQGQTLHWAKPTAPERMLGSSSQRTAAGQPEESIDFRAAPPVWHRDTSDFLRKFRNYEI
ncbi:hypothetical protein FHG87_018808 [Trinorchestia longiramus]|nr:hypothetical protein FHG87_018808 [Trinorchestia longiramus]